MKKLIVPLIAAAIITAGCVASRQQVITPNPVGGGFTTNVVWVVNTNNLIVDSAAASVVTAVAVNAAIIGSHNDANVVQALKNAQTALGGILQGATFQTRQQVVEILRAQGNPALTEQVNQLVDALSSLEQDMLQKYGQTVAGQISVSLTRAVYTGLNTGLA